MNSSTAARLPLTHTSSKYRRTRALFFSCSDDTAASSSSSFFLPTGVHLPRDGNIYDATRGARRMARRPIHRSLEHPSTTEDQDQDHLHACNDGWVTIGQIALDPETGEEVEEFALYL